jgi:DNA-directed RNA polymerase subunit RPC12/RpoP
MITLTVYYGNHNKFNIDLPATFKLGLLVTVLPVLINKAIRDILYIIIGDSLVGSETSPFSKSLGECNIIDNKCTAHMILKDSDEKYPDNCLYLSSRNQVWVSKDSVPAPITINSSLSMNQPIIEGDEATTGFSNGLRNFFEAIGGFNNVDFTTLQDVAVVIPEDEYDDYVVTPLDSIPDYVCSICQTQITNINDGAQLECGHCFHKNCIKEWLTTRSVKCPSCNYDVRGE